MIFRCNLSSVLIAGICACEKAGSWENIDIEQGASCGWYGNRREEGLLEASERLDTLLGKLVEFITT